jgi:hypothetical protein
MLNATALRWLRQAIAAVALGCVIACGGMEWGPTVVRAEIPAVEAVEIGVACDTKRVSIFDRTEDVYGLFSTMESIVLIGTELPNQSYCHDIFGVRPQHGNASDNTRLVIYRLAFRGIVNQPYCNKNLKVRGGRLTAIFEDNISHRSSAGFDAADGNVSNEDVSPQLFFSRAASKIDRVRGGIGGALSSNASFFGLLPHRACLVPSYPS